MSLMRHEQRGGPDSAIIRRVRLAMASAACCLVVIVGLASAQAQQQAQPQPPPQREFHGGGEAVPHQQQPQAEPPVEAEPVPSYRPGFLDALGRWFGDPKAALDSQVRSTQEALGGTLGTLGGQARDAAGNVIALPGTRVITGRQLCPPASNGAPDCEQGVEALCRAKGFQGGGRTIDVTSAQRCPARVYLENRAPKQGECRTETYVTRAVCQ
ncbi:MAG TPA: hypothetical protein VFB68_11245 [Xanthobacteraceae bacterium]|nr:hypothetical protein [Xanthobacteraceae bacterium]